MDIEPVIRKDRCSLNNQHHRQIIPVAETVRRLDDFRWRCRIQGMNEVMERHSRDEVCAAILHSLACRGSPADTFNPSLAMTNAIDVDTVERHGATLRQ